MIRSILLKEWIKTRWVVIGIFIALTAYTCYEVMNIFHAFRYNGTMSLWEMIIQKDYTLVGGFKYVPVAIGIVLSLFQMIPELLHKRLKLTLHLPIARHKMIGYMIGYGLGILTLSFILSIGTTMIILSQHFAIEILKAWTLAILPWIGAGYLSYLAMAWIAIEPTWKGRAIVLAIWFLLNHLFLYPSASQAMVDMMPLHIVLLGLIGASIFYATIRFKEGKQA
ncbi:MAG: hypothetical protein ACPGSG_06090 [Prolixibacteraceae bacterium]